MINFSDLDTIIEQLLPIMDQKNFADLFDDLTNQESNHQRFLIKMELHRRIQPCRRSINLKEKSDLPCFEIEQQDLRHFLNEPAKTDYTQTIELYGNNFSIGVYEKVIILHEKRNQQQLDELEAAVASEHHIISPLTAPIVKLNTAFDRHNEKINHNVKILVTQSGKNEQKAILAELTLATAIIHLPLQQQLNFDKELALIFVALGKGFDNDILQTPIKYQITNYQKNNDYIVARLTCLTKNNDLTPILKKLIKKCKKRDKFDAKDVVNTTFSRGLEWQYLSHYAHLPVFVQTHNKDCQITHCLQSQKNTNLTNYFYDENNIHQISQFLSPERMSNIIHDPTNTDHQLFFSFSHQVNGCKYFYSASYSELINNQMLGVFIGFGSTKNSWRIFQIRGHEIPQHINYKSSLLPGDLPEYPFEVQEQLSKFSHLFQIIDMTNTHSQKGYQSWYQDEDINSLKIFGQPKAKNSNVHLISMQFNERRQENRYALKTLVQLSQNSTDTSAVSIDVSEKGFQVMLDNEVTFDQNEPVNIALPMLQEIAGETRLTALPYNIVAIRNRKILHLSAIIGTEPHVGAEFMKKMLLHNKHKLQELSGHNTQLKNLADGMKYLLMQHLYSLPLFIEQTSNSANCSAIGVTQSSSPLINILSQGKTEPKEIDLTCLFKDEETFQKSIINNINDMDPNMPMTYIEVFIKITGELDSPSSIECFFEDEVGDHQAQCDFILSAKTTGHFLALRIYRGACYKANLHYIGRELQYLKIHAHQHVKKLEQKLKLLTGIAELIDITQEMELRFPEIHPHFHQKITDDTASEPTS